MPNLSGGYHGILKQWWEYFRLGSRVLLVSETIPVREQFARRYPQSEFVCTDYFVGLYQESQRSVDVSWNLYEPPPQALRPGSFDSVICQATLEHIHDPVAVLARLATLLAEGGVVYLHTHTPGFVYHPFPRDYLRFHPDWFEDVPMSIPSLELLELFCVAGHAFSAFRRKSG